MSVPIINIIFEIGPLIFLRVNSSLKTRGVIYKQLHTQISCAFLQTTK